MRVACVSHGSIVPLNRRPYDLLRERHGVDLTLIVPERWTGDLPNPDLRYEPVPGGAPTVALAVRWSGDGSLFLLRGLAATLRTIAPDLVLLDEEPWSLVAWQTRRATEPMVPLVFYSKQNIAKRLPPPFGWIRGRTYRRTHSAWAVGVTTEAVLRATGFTNEIAVVPHGVEIGRFTPGRDEDRRRALGLDGVVIGYAGRLVSEKGIDDLLAAAAILARDQSLPRFTLLVAGSGPLIDACQLARADLGPRLVTLPAVPHNEAPGLYRLMDIFVLPSRATSQWTEQFGRALVEAAATRLAIVGADTGEIPHVVRALGGRTVPERKPEDLATALRGYLVDAAARDRDAAAALAKVRRDFSQEAVAAQMAGLLAAVHGSPRPSPLSPLP